MNKNIKIAKDLIKLAKLLLSDNDIDKKVNEIVNNTLKSNPEKAIDELSTIMNDKQFDELAKQVKLAFANKNSVVAYKDDFNTKTVEKEIYSWEKFVKKLVKYCSGKPRYVLAAAAALMMSYLQLQVGKATWLNGLVSTSNHASIEQFGAFIILITTYFGSVPVVFNMINNICKKAGFNNIDELKREIK